MQSALQVGTEEEFEQELPALREQIDEMLGDTLRGQGLDLDAMLADSKALETICEKATAKAHALKREAGGDLGNLRADLVRTPGHPATSMREPDE